MANSIYHKKTNVPSKVPTVEQLELGEIAINTFDGCIFIKKNDGTDSIVKVGDSSGIEVQINKLPYDNRGELRNIDGPEGTSAIVSGLGLFVFETGSDEPDDDESCFATASGRWLIEAVHWDVVESWQLPEQEIISERLDSLENYVESQYDSFVFLTGIYNSALSSLAANASQSYTVTIAGAVVGDSVILNPPGTQATGVYGGAFAYVSAVDTVKIVFTAIDVTSYFPTGNWKIAVIKKI